MTVLAFVTPVYDHVRPQDQYLRGDPHPLGCLLAGDDWSHRRKANDQSHLVV